MSLVADYGTESDSDESGDLDEQATKVQSAGEECTSTHNYLITTEEDLSSSDDEKKTEGDSSEKKEKLPNPLVEKLPTPVLGSASSLGLSKAAEGPGSVFANPFENAEMAKQSILEKHVKMTEAQLLTGKKAKVCKAFKQGRCRYGKHCQYSHDLDANLSARYKQEETVEESSQGTSESANQSRLPKHLRLPPPPQQKGFMGTVNTLHSGPKHVPTPQQRAHYIQQQHHMQAGNDDDDDDDKFNVGDKRKKRVGLSQTLVPPKRAMSSLNKQRVSERPWTVPKQY